MSKHLYANTTLDAQNEIVKELQRKAEQEKQDAEERRLELEERIRVEAERKRQIFEEQQKNRALSALESAQAQLLSFDSSLVERYVLEEFDNLKSSLQEVWEMFTAGDIESSLKQVRIVKRNVQEVLELAYQRKTEQDYLEYMMQCLIQVLSGMGYRVSSLNSEGNNVSLAVVKEDKTIAMALSSDGKMYCDLHDAFSGQDCHDHFDELINQVRELGIGIVEEETVIDKRKQGKVIDGNRCPLKS